MFILSHEQQHMLVSILVTSCSGQLSLLPTVDLKWVPTKGRGSALWLRFGVIPVMCNSLCAIFTNRLNGLWHGVTESEILYKIWHSLAYDGSKKSMKHLYKISSLQFNLFYVGDDFNNRW